MKRVTLVVLAAAAFLVASGCKSSTGPDQEDLVGAWDATKAEFVSVANSGTSVDVVAQGGTVTLVLTASSFTMTIQELGESAWVGTGTWSNSMDTITLTWSTGSSGESQFDFVLDGDHLTLEGGHMSHEFTPGSPEEAILNLIMVRQ